MVARFKFWMIVNVYALLLDIIALMMFLIAVSLFRISLVSCILLVSMGAFLLYGAIGIHGTYGEKKRIYTILLRKNIKAYRMESFKDFLSVPCHRVVVRLVLNKLSLNSEYKKIKGAYYVYPWKRKFLNETVIHIFTTKEEGDKWLLQQKNKIA